MSLPRLLKGSIASVADQIVRAVAALVVTPVMVAKLGVADFGVWVLLTGLFSQFLLLDPGLQSSLPRFLVVRDEGKLRAVASTAQGLYWLVALASALVTFIIWMALPIFFPASDALVTARTITILLGAANVTVTLTRVPTLYLQSLLRRDLISCIAMARVLVCSGLVLWLLLQRGGGLFDVALVHSIGSMAESLLLAWCGRELFPRMRREWMDRSVARSLLGFSGWSYLISNCERLRSGLDGFVLGWLRGSNSAGVYSLGARPVSMVFEIVYACIGMQLLPAFTRLRETGAHDRLGAAFVLITRLSAYLSVTAAGMTIILGPAFLQCWVPEHAIAARQVLLCLALPFALQVAQVPAVHLLYAIAEHRMLALAQTLGLILNLTLSIVFAYWFGIVGAVLGTAIEILLLHGIVIPLLIAKKADIAPVRFLWTAQVVPLFQCAAAFVLPAIAVLKWMPAQPTVFHLAAMGGAICVWIGGWAWMLGIGRREMKELGLALR